VGESRENVVFHVVRVGYRGGFASYCLGFSLRSSVLSMVSRAIEAQAWVISAVCKGFRRARVGLRRVSEGQPVSGENDNAQWRKAGYQRAEKKWPL
jgi:hypothetical protein